MQTDTDGARLGLLPSTDASGRSFRWLRLLGQGGFGEVYLARMRSAGGLEQQVAVKLLHPGLDPVSQPVERLRDEARLLASLHHPVILAAHDLAILGDRVALVTEFIEGQDLSACVRGSARMPPSTVLEVVELVAGALHTAFVQHRVVHRDIKPSNVRIGVHGNVKLLDFGIARSGLTDREARTQSQMMVGTLRYMAPERLANDAEPDPASDVFALGALLYEGASRHGLLEQVEITRQVRLSAQPDLWSGFLEERLQGLQASEQVPEGLQALLREMLAHDAAARPMASEVAERCEALTARFAAHVRLSRWCRTRRWPAEAPSTGTVPTPEATPAPTPASGTLWQSDSRDIPAARPAAEPVSRSSTRPSSGSIERPRTGETRRGSGRLGWAAAAVAGGGGLLGLGLLGGCVLLLVWGWLSWPAADPLLAVAESETTSETPAGSVAAPKPHIFELPSPSEPIAASTPPAPPRSEVEKPTKSQKLTKVREVAPVAPEVAPLPEPSPPVPPPAPARTYPVLLMSDPTGAQIVLVATGERRGITPQRIELPAGRVAVRLEGPGGVVTEQTLQIGKNSPGQYTWDIEKDKFVAGY